MSWLRKVCLCWCSVGFRSRLRRAGMAVCLRPGGDAQTLTQTVEVKVRPGVYEVQQASIGDVRLWARTWCRTRLRMSRDDIIALMGGNAGLLDTGDCLSWSGYDWRFGAQVDTDVPLLERGIRGSGNCPVRHSSPPRKLRRWRTTTSRSAAEFWLSVEGVGRWLGGASR